MRQLSVTSLSIVIVSLCLTFTTSAQTRAKDDSIRNFHQVNSELYRGGQPTKRGIEKLAQLGIKTVINLRDNDQRADEELKVVTGLGLSYFNIPLPRIGGPSSEQMLQLLELINDPANQPVFVHCRRGSDRTGVAIAIYRISHDGWTNDRAIKEAKDFGMGFWHLGMKNYIRSYKDQQPVQKATAQPHHDKSGLSLVLDRARGLARTLCCE